MKLFSFIKKLSLDSASRDMLVGVGIAFVVGVNLLITALPVKLDLSKGKAHTLTAATKKIVSSLKNPVKITFFVNQDLPSKLQQTKQDVSDMLAQLKQESSQIQIVYLDPKSDQAAQKTASEYGIQEVQFQIIENDQFVQSGGYFGLGVEYVDATSAKKETKKEAVPSLEPATLEYTIASMLYKASQSNPKKVGIFGAGPNMSMFGQKGGESIDVLKKILAEQGPVEQVDLEKLDSTVRPLVVLDGDQAVYGEKGVAAISQYLDKGGAAIVLTDGVRVSPQLAISSPSAHLKPILDAYGVQVQPKLTLSRQAEIINYGGGGGQQFMSNYPYWLRTNVFNPEASYASNIQYLTFQWASPIVLQKMSNVTQLPLVRTTPQSWTVESPKSLMPQDIQKPNEYGTYTLMAHAKNTQTNGELIVVPTTKFVQDDFLGPSGNMEMMLNLILNFSSDGALAGIRSRAVANAPLPQISEGMKNQYKWGNILFLPVLFAGYGAYRLWRRQQATQQSG